MKAILMGAGIGSRFGSNYQRPKCTVSLGELTLIEHTVALLRQNNIEVAVAVGYKREIIEKALEKYDVSFFYNPFYRVTNSMASLWFSQTFFTPGEDTILANADVFWERNILDKILRDEHPIMMLGDSSRVHEGDYFFGISKEQWLNLYGKDIPLEGRSCEYVGIARIKGDFVSTFLSLLNQSVSDGIYDMWWENVLYENFIEHPIYVKDVENCFWGEVDYPEDYQRVLHYLTQKAVKQAL